MTQQYNNVVGGGQELEGKSKQYAVAYCPGDNPAWGTYNPVVTVMPGSDRKAQLEGVYLTNTAWVKSFATQGDKNFGRPAFEEGSFFIVTITADNGKKVEVPLIDYRNKKREVVNDWKWVDLSSLGEVKTIKFSIQSSDTYAPSYFAMDNLHIKQDASTKPAKEQIALELVATTESTAQIRWQTLPTQVSYTVSYRPVGADASATQTMRIDPTQQLRSLELRDGYVYTTLEGLQTGTRYEVTVEATIMPAMQTVAQGKTTFTIQSTAINAIDSETARIVATPEGILVMGLQGATIELYTASGAQIGHYQITETEQLIAEPFQSGIYIVAAHKAGEVRTFRLIL